MYQTILLNIAKHIRLTDDEQEYFTSLLHIKKLKKHQYLVQEGDVCRYEAFIHSGCSRSFYVDAKGIEHVVMFGVEDWWIGDMYSFLTQTPSKTNVIVEEATELFCLDKPSLEKIYEHIPKFERFFRIIIQNAYIAQQDRITASMSKSAEERYKDFISRYPQFEARFPQYQIASYLGITPESLSRIRRQQLKNDKS